MMASSGSSTAGAEASRPPSLGLSLTTAGCGRAVRSLTAAARRAGVRVDLFLTGDGVELLRDEALPTLLERVERIGVCEVSARQRGIRPEDVTGLMDRDFVTQARNAELVGRCNRYLVL